MLTGDKLETAENIARSCTLIQPNFAIIKLLKNDNVENCKDQLMESYGIARLNQNIHKPKGLLVEGETLALIFKNEILTDMFIDIVELCETVICCRVTPKQKAEVVKLVKEFLGKVE
jgi:magnesium-transporting ATPase (P-type)